MKFIKNKKLWKNAIVIVVIVGIFVGFMCYCNNLNNKIEKVAAEKESVETKMNEIMGDLESTKNELDAVRKELDVAHEEVEKYKKEIEDEDAKWKRKYEEFPVATEAWIAMKNNGWSDIVCAGIMGNLMAETGGGTLRLDWDSNGENGYGLVQWIGGRRNAIENKYGTHPSVKEQVQFIHDELFGVNGVRRQVTKGQLNAIMNAETPEECAYAFACYYERCSENVRSIRRGFARKAYNYFVEV